MQDEWKNHPAKHLSSVDRDSGLNALRFTCVRPANLETFVFFSEGSSQ